MLITCSPCYRLVDALEWLVGLLHGLPEVMPPDFPWVMLKDLVPPAPEEAAVEEAAAEPAGEGVFPRPWWGYAGQPVSNSLRITLPWRAFPSFSGRHQQSLSLAWSCGLECIGLLCLVKPPTLLKAGSKVASQYCACALSLQLAWIMSPASPIQLGSCARQAAHASG